MNPLCRECEKEGIVAPGEITDHIIPKNICSDPWDTGNWQNLCKKHHVRKAARDKQLIRKQRNERPARPENRI
jgi:5-methylcytosine-specific restriction endonuclease McrA